MKNAYRLVRSRKISLSVQRLNLSAQTDGYCMSKKRHSIRWRYTTRPNAIGRDYDVLISYQVGYEPKAFVISPKLCELTESLIPHLYHNTKDHEFRSAACLCLYMKKYGEWHSEKLISDTIVPWVDLWLLYFEYWLATGEWEGGGEHPD